MILYGEDRFPAKELRWQAVLDRTQYPGDSLRSFYFSSAEELPQTGHNASRSVSATNTAEGLRLSRRFFKPSEEMKQIVMVTDGKPAACYIGDSFNHPQPTKASDTTPKRRLYKNSMGGDPFVMTETFKSSSLS
jgi:uncharacterized protein with von Willebrand factor type A (vWA) domain